MVTLPKFISDPNPDIYLSNNYIVIDLETTNLDKGDAVNECNRLVYGYWADSIGNNGDVFDLSDLHSAYTQNSNKDFWIVQGGKFELKWLIRAGVPIEKILIYDTLLAERVIAGNRKIKLDLDSLSKRYGGVGKKSIVSRMIEAGICPSEIPFKLLKAYCIQDVKETERVFLKQREVLRHSGLLAVQYLRCITTPVLADIEMHGLFLDQQLVRKLHAEATYEYSIIIKELNEITGGINMASTDQVAEFLYGKLGFTEVVPRGKPNKKFPEGKPKTDEDTILLLKPTTDVQRRFIELKKKESKLRRKITGYLNKFMDACEKDNCLIHGTLNQTIADTHRLTSSEPNLQNIDRKLKKVITARKKGNRILSADYRQLEFRIAGVLSQDKQILQDIIDDFDVHSYTASIIFSKEWKEAGSTKKSKKGDAIRTEAKPQTFKPLYGGNSGTKAQVAYYKAFREKYSTTYNMQLGWVQEVLRTKKLRTVTGLIFYWPDVSIDNRGYVNHTSSIFNYPVQMFATADISPTGVCLLWHNMKARGLKSFIINEVHDSVLVEAEADECDLLGNLIPQSMSKDIVWFFKKLINFDLNFPLEVEVKNRSHWDWENEQKDEGEVRESSIVSGAST